MRFFSNDARESTDEQAHDERPERVQSDPVAVPGQRPPSPWSNTPATDDPAAVDTDRRDGVEESDTSAEADRAETDPPPFHEPSPQPTAFGAPTDGGAEDDRRDATDRDPAADSDDDDALGDRVVSSSTNTYAGSTASTAPDTVPATWTEHDLRNGHDHGEPDGALDLPLDDKGTTDSDAAPAEADHDSDTSAAPDTDQAKNEEDTVTLKSDALKEDAADQRSDDSTVEDGDRPGPEAVTTTEADAKTDVDTTTDADTGTDAGPLKDDGDFDDPKAVDPVTEAPLDADRTPDDSPSDDAPAQSTPPAEVAVPVAAAAVAAPAATADTLFDREDARTFQERWRDVQLRFVDSPKDAAAEAAELVDEAVEKLTASLRSQRDGLTNDTEDTEQLRVQLRGYRDILNRILSL